jgi:hemolysin activation/secretion protein
MAWSGPAAAAARLTGVEVIDAHHATAVQLFLDEPVPGASTVIREGPTRLIVRLPGVVDASGGTPIEVGGLRAARVRVESRDDGIAVVVEAGDAVDPFQGHGISFTDNGLLVTVGLGPAVARGGAARPPAPEPVAAEEGAAVVEAAEGAGGEAEGVAVAEPEEVVEEAAAPPAREETVPVPEEAVGVEEEAVLEAAPVVESVTIAEPPAVAAPPAGGLPEPTRADGLPYDVTAFELAYAREHPEHPPIEELMNLEVELGQVAGGFVAPREGIPHVRIELADVPLISPQVFYGSAIRTIDERIVEEFVGRGLAGVLVLPDEEEIDPHSSRDLRPEGQTGLRIVIWTGRLLEYRTYAAGERIPEDERSDNPAHARIKKYSPVQPGDLLDKKAIDAYVERLNRHPGRNVSTTLSAAGEPGGVYLDYLVAENKPINAYFQASNTGTDGTTDWRQRFGFAHNQLTGRDDILRLDYITGNFDQVNAVFGSYDVPLIGIDRLRANVGGSWAEYNSSQFGFVTSKFDGDQWDVSGELRANVVQLGEFFADLFFGLRYQDVSVDNLINPVLPPIHADSQYFFPSLGLRFERRTDTSQLAGSIGNDWNAPGATGVSAAEMALMGGIDNPALYDPSFAILRWQASGSAYLEPLLDPAGYADPSTHWSSTQAHEVYLGMRGQYAYDNHLIPQHQMVAGGYYTVRGYPQASIAGDNVYFGRAEYRLHVPRLFRIQPAPVQVPLLGDFRVAPDQPYGRPDWDFIIRGFFDAARVTVNKKQPGQTNDTLLSPGVGGELRYKDTLVVNVDWGYALNTIRNGLVKKGHDEVWFLVTLIY